MLSFDHPLSAADLETRILEVLRDNRPGKSVRGCHSHMAVYAHALQHAVIAPQLAAWQARGQLGPIDDDGHDTEIVRAWRRVAAGKGNTWDCRSVGNVFLFASLHTLNRRHYFCENPDWDKIDDAILRNLPNILTGSGIQRPVTNMMMKSWVTGQHVWLRMDGLKPITCEEDGGPLRRIELKNGGKPFALNPGGQDELILIMGFADDSIDHALSDRAWNAWMRRAREYSPSSSWDSMAGLIRRNNECIDHLGISWLSLRQDEAVSVDAGPDGFTLYRGAVEGTAKTISDEGQLHIGTREAWMSVLTKGGFQAEEAGKFLDDLCRTSCAFSAPVPTGSQARICIDPETLYAFDLPEDEVTRAESKAEAIPIFAAGTFEMPEMKTWRQRKAAADHMPAATIEPSTDI